MRGEFFQPTLANRAKRDSPADTGGAMDNARAVVERIRTAEPTSCLLADVRERILERFPNIREAETDQVLST
jgi:hypothetical protein